MLCVILFCFVPPRHCEACERLLHLLLCSKHVCWIFSNVITNDFYWLELATVSIKLPTLWRISPRGGSKQTRLITNIYKLHFTHNTNRFNLYSNALTLHRTYHSWRFQATSTFMILVTSLAFNPTLNVTAEPYEYSSYFPR